MKLNHFWEKPSPQIKILLGVEILGFIIIGFSMLFGESDWDYGVFWNPWALLLSVLSWGILNFSLGWVEKNFWSNLGFLLWFYGCWWILVN